MRKITLFTKHRIKPANKLPNTVYYFHIRGMLTMVVAIYIELFKKENIIYLH